MLNKLKELLKNDGIKFEDRGGTIAVLLQGGSNLYLFSSGDSEILCDPDDDISYIKDIHGHENDVNDLFKRIKNNI